MRFSVTNVSGAIASVKLRGGKINEAADPSDSTAFIEATVLSNPFIHHLLTP